MTNHTTIIEILREAFAEPSDKLRTYLNAYEALSMAAPGMHMLAIEGTRAAWRALDETERQAVDDALEAMPLKVAS